MDKSSFDLEEFQAEVDRVLLSMLQPRAAGRAHSTDVAGHIIADSTCNHTTHSDIDMLPINIRPDIALLQRMLHLTQLEPKQRQELERLDLKVHCLVQWYQQKKTALRCASDSSSDVLRKLQCFFQNYAGALANRIETYWVVLEPQVKQQEQAECQRYVLSQKQAKLERLLELEPDNEEWLAELARLNSNTQWRPVHRAYLCQTYEHTLQRKAQEIVTCQDILPLLSLNLQSASDDVFEISKKITPILAILAITEIVAIPLVPALFASVVLILHAQYKGSRVTHGRSIGETVGSVERDTGMVSTLGLVNNLHYLH